MLNKGSSAMEILVMMVLVVITSGVILLLVNAGILTVKADSSSEPILNAEFIPLGREGSLVVKEFMFCADVDDLFHCGDPKVVFKLGEDIHFRFLVESSTYEGNVMLLENYRVKGPDGKVLLDVDEKNTYHFDVASRERMEQIYFKDHLVSEEGDASGVYTFELIVENPLLNKRVTLTEEFEIER